MSKPYNEPRVTRTSDPMAFSSILSNNVADPPIPVPRPAHPPKQTRKSAQTANGDTSSNSPAPRKSHQKPALSSSDYPGLLRRPIKTEPDSAAPGKASSSRSKASTIPAEKAERESEKVRKELARIEAMDLSDIESPRWALEKEKHARASHKRYLDVEESENTRRKVS